MPCIGGMMVPYNYKNYLGGLEGSGSDNALGLVPSLDPTGKRYPYKLGGAYAKFMIRISVSNLMYMKAMANIAVCLSLANW